MPAPHPAPGLRGIPEGSKSVACSGARSATLKAAVLVPGGNEARSRGVTRSGTPGFAEKRAVHPGRGARGRVGAWRVNRKAHVSVTPSRVRALTGAYPVVSLSLNHRLRALLPPGTLEVTGDPCLHPQHDGSLSERTRRCPLGRRSGCGRCQERMPLTTWPWTSVRRNWRPW